LLSVNNDELRYAEERHTRILDLLNRQGRVEVNLLAELFTVSTQTIRRDLAEMEKRQLLQRTHGGAVLPGIPTRYDAPFTEREVSHSEEKRRIGAAAAELVRDDETIIMDAGSTTLEVARHLRGKRNLTVVTNALNICGVLAGVNGIELYVPGGQYLHSNMSLVGSTAEEAIGRFNFDKAIIGTRTIDLARGYLCMPNLPEAQVQRAIIAAAQTVIVAADHSKFGHSAFALSVPLKSVDVVVTDHAIHPDHIAGLEAHQITVITA
jgi:DeoR family fructose operon transcriptional repressor